MTFQPPDWWYKTWVGEWTAEDEAEVYERRAMDAREDAAAEAKEAGREEQC